VSDDEDKKTSEHIPEYLEFSKGDQWMVYVSGIGRASPVRVSQHPILQSRVNKFWEALRRGTSGKDLHALFDAALPSSVRTDLPTSPFAAMEILADYDLRFADPIAEPLIRKLVGDWLDKCRRSSVPGKRGRRQSPGVVKRRGILRRVMKDPEDLSDPKKVRSLFAALEKDFVPIPGNIHDSTDWLQLLDDPMRENERHDALSNLRKDFERS
jgi:hypothetical protein